MEGALGSLRSVGSESWQMESQRRTVGTGCLFHIGHSEAQKRMAYGRTTLDLAF